MSSETQYSGLSNERSSTRSMQAAGGASSMGGMLGGGAEYRNAAQPSSESNTAVPVTREAAPAQQQYAPIEQVKAYRPNDQSQSNIFGGGDAPANKYSQHKHQDNNIFGGGAYAEDSKPKETAKEKPAAGFQSQQGKNPPGGASSFSFY